MDKELHCLVSNVYYEAKGESFKGKIAVALVTLNRVDDARYPDSICSVVYQKNQFSWTRTRKHSKIDNQLWESSKVAALTALMNRDYLGTFKATHFHNTKVSPNWGLKRLVKIGGHIFYA